MSDNLNPGRESIAADLEYLSTSVETLSTGDIPAERSGRGRAAVDYTHKDAAGQRYGTTYDAVTGEVISAYAISNTGLRTGIIR